MPDRSTPPVKQYIYYPAHSYSHTASAPSAQAAGRTQVKAEASGRSTGIGGDIFAITILATFTLLFFYPVLSHGIVYGSMSDLSLFPLTSGLFKTMHNAVSTDNLQQIGPWLLLNWKTIHSGQLPLWNQYSLLGLPQMFNFQSGVLSLPHLISYLSPASWSYTVSNGVSLLIAGTGVYSAARALGANSAGALVGAVTYEFSGSLVNWIAWPQGDVNAWLGWIICFIVLINRSKRPMLGIAGLSVSVAFAIYAGHPESYVLDAFTIVLLAALVVLFSIFTGEIDYTRLKSSLLKVAIGGIIGVMLAMPMLLPSVQLIPSSIRSLIKGTYRGLPIPSSAGLLTNGYYGLPATGSHWFGPQNYYEISAVVGPLAIALALVAVIRMGKRPVVGGIATTALVLWLIIFRNGPVQSLVSLLHASGAIIFSRLLMPLDFLLAILAAIGFSRITAPDTGDGEVHAFAISAGIMLGILAYLIVSAEITGGLTAQERQARLASLGWSLGSLTIGATFILAWLLLSRRAGSRGLKSMPGDRRYATGTTKYRTSSIGHLWQIAMFFAVLLAQGIVLMPTAIQSTSYSHRFFPATTSVKKVKRLVGGSLMGAAAPPSSLASGWYPTFPIPGTGFEPETNIAYGIDLFAAHDPMIPKEYISSWQYAANSTKSDSSISPGVFNPWFSSAALARLYGIKYLFALPGSNPPTGTTLSLAEKNFSVYEVPNSERYSLISPKDISRTSATVREAENPPSGYGRVTSSRWISNNNLQLHVNARKKAALLARMTYVPGWHATINGRGVAVHRAAGTMLSIKLPAGKSTVELTYWPSTFTVGIIAAIIAVVFLMVLAVFFNRGHRHGAHKRRAKWSVR